MDTQNPWGSDPTPFDALGGQDRVRAIVDIEAPNLRAMLPADDAVSRHKLYEYLVEWTGGLALYSSHSGHPRMRMRHTPFAIGETEVGEWLTCFGRSLDDNDVTGDIRGFLDAKIATLAHHMRNK